MSDTASAVEADIAWTERQRQVLDLLARGKTNPEIAEALGISLAGAKWHVSEVISKLGVTSREEAAAWWQQQRRVGARISRAARLLLGLPAAKWAAGVSVGVVAATTGIITAASLYGGPEPAPDLAKASLTSSIFTQQEAEDAAKQRAQELILDAYKFSTDSGRRLTAADFATLEATFSPAATTVESNVLAGTEQLGEPTDVWSVKLALRPPETATFGGGMHVLVVIADGTGELLSGGELAPKPLGTSSFELARTELGPSTLVLASIPDQNASPSAADEGACAWLRVIDSRNLTGPYMTACYLLEAVPGDPLVHTSVHNGRGLHAWGFVTDGVAIVRLVNEDGVETLVTPTPASDPRIPYRAFLASAAEGDWFVTIEALDMAGEVIGTVDWSNHPGRFASSASYSFQPLPSNP